CLVSHLNNSWSPARSWCACYWGWACGSWSASVIVVKLLLCLALAGGAEQRVYLVESPAPVELVLAGGATARRFPVDDSADGARETITLTLPLGASAEIGGQPVGSWRVVLPQVVKGRDDNNYT